MYLQGSVLVGQFNVPVGQFNVPDHLHGSVCDVWSVPCGEDVGQEGGVLQEVGGEAGGGGGHLPPQ